MTKWLVEVVSLRCSLSREAVEDLRKREAISLVPNDLSSIYF